jgi:hypothetical protein
MLFAILTMVGGLLIVALIFVVMCYPKLFSDFGKLLVKPFRNGKTDLESDKEDGGTNSKVKKNSPEGVLIARLESMEPGQVLLFKINPIWGARYISAELNGNLFQNKKTYLISMRDTPKPGDGKNDVLYNSDDTYFIAKSILGREGELLVQDDKTSLTEKEFKSNTEIRNNLIGAKR